jgi:DNA-binding response OmpR family regulator
MPRAKSSPSSKSAAKNAEIKVLLVDDDEFLSDIYGTKLTRDGFTVVIAHDGIDGYAKAVSGKPDIILLDVMMPKQDGFETLKQIRGNADIADTPVIMLTNLGQKEDVDKAMSAGANEYMIKAHFVPGDAVKKIHELLAKKK